MCTAFSNILEIAASGLFKKAIPFRLKLCQYIPLFPLKFLTSLCLFLYTDRLLRDEIDIAAGLRLESYRRMRKVFGKLFFFQLPVLLYIHTCHSYQKECM